MNNLLLQYTALISSGALMSCFFWVSLVVAQTAINEETIPPTTSAPEENLQGSGEIDYENAKPMPLPSLPDPAPSETLPELPSLDGSPGPPAYSPGNPGTGEKTPQILVPPKPLSEINPTDDPGSAERKYKKLF
jgi:hypothetical protein